MGEYLTPGVYVEEISNGARPIQAVGTRTAGFVGQAPDLGSSPLQAVLVTNWSEFTRKFVPPPGAGDQGGNPVKGSQGDLDRLNKAAQDAQKVALVQNQSVEVYQAWKALQEAQADFQLDPKPAKQARIDQAEASLVSKIKAQQVRIKDKEADPTQVDALDRWSAATSRLEDLKTRLGPDPASLAADPEAQGVVAEVDTAEKAVIEQFTAKLTAIEQDLNKELEAATQKAAQPTTDAGPYLADAVYGFFLNGGSRCYVVNLGATGTLAQGLKELEKIDEVAIVAAPGYVDYASYVAVRDHCDTLKDRVGILDCPPKVDDDVLKALGGEEPDEGAPWQMPAASQYGDLTIYAPWLVISDPSATRRNGSGPAKKLVPPSGHIAGIWARNDVERGVYKAPANEPVRGAIDLERRITHSEQGELNRHGVNVIRYFPNAGFLVWGARTLTNNEEFRYLNVRRFFNMVEESILESTRWIVFEPNDRPLWQAIRRDVTSFLMGYWREGALMGKTPQEAFYVKCDDETNPLDSIKEGKVIIEVGLAPVRPAEFVIFRISQYEASAEVEGQR